jgi:MFS family permease
MPIFISFTAIGLMPMIYTNSWELLLWGRALIGIGSSAAIVGALQIFRVIYPNNFAKMLGLSVFSGLITIVFLGNILTNFIALTGLKPAMMILAYSGLGLAAISYFLMPKKDNEELAKGSFGRSLKIIFTNPYIIATSLCAGLMVGPLEGFADAWGSIFLLKAYNIAKLEADYFIFFIYLGMAAGCILLPYLADKTNLFFELTILSGIVMCVCFILLFNQMIRLEYISYLLGIIGLFCAYQVIIISRISCFVTAENSAIAASIANMIIMIFGWGFHKIIGYNLDRKWHDNYDNEGMKSYDLLNYTDSLAVIPYSIIIALIGLLVIRVLLLYSSSHESHKTTPPKKTL